MLADVSSEYYVRLERGNLGGVSDSVLDAVANALQLDVAERCHLFDLARAAGGPAKRATKQSTPKGVRPVVQRPAAQQRRTREPPEGARTDLGY